MSDKDTVNDDMVVSLDYTLRSDDEEVLDSSEGRPPLQFIQGKGQIISGLENELYGMEVGQEKRVIVPPEDGYGPWQEEQVQNLPRNVFPENMELEEGMGVELRDTNSGRSYQAFIKEIQPETVVVDFNHPLAGETLYFDVKIVSLREATREERNHGHVHEPGAADH